MIRALLELDCIPVGMEFFPAASTDQWTYIQRVIDDSDYYLVILGGRYGSMTEEGISFTEREYDYAISKRIPVITFVHRDIGELPAKKVEAEEAKRQKLERFRDKVRRRLCKEWSDSKELAAAVTPSVWKLKNDEPKDGWVRGNTASDPGTVNRLREQILQMEAELERLRISPPDGADGLASGRDTVKFELTMTYYPKTGGLEVLEFRVEPKRRPFEVEVSWDDLLRTIGPSMLDESSEDVFFQRLQSYLATNAPGVDGHSATPSLRREDFETVLVQFIALGLVEKSPRKHTASDRNTYWRVTKYGELRVMQLKAIQQECPF